MNAAAADAVRSNRATTELEEDKRVPAKPGGAQHIDVAADGAVR